MDLVSRVKGILLSPKHEWATIDTEAATVGSLFTGYIMPLAAIPAIAGFIGSSIIGRSFMGVYAKSSISSGLTSAIIGFVMSLVSCYVMALIIDALAPSFGGQKSQIQALKVAAYSSTAAWLAGIATIVPAASILGLVALYSLYLLYVGLPVLMKAPAEKAMGYTVVVIIASIILYVVVAAIVVAVAGTGMMLGR